MSFDLKVLHGHYGAGQDIPPAGHTSLSLADVLKAQSTRP